MHSPLLDRRGASSSGPVSINSDVCGDLDLKGLELGGLDAAAAITESEGKGLVRY